MGNPQRNDYMDTSAKLVDTAVTNQFVTFTCAGRGFGIDIMAVREIRSWSATTQLPAQPFGAKGVLDIRGSIIQVYDLAVMIGSGYSDTDTSSQVVLVVSLPGQDVGLLVDTVSDIVFAQAEDLRPVPPAGQDNGRSMISGLVKIEDRLMAILDLGALFPAITSNVAYL